jgi:hypothetical protein
MLSKEEVAIALGGLAWGFVAGNPGPEPHNLRIEWNGDILTVMEDSAK